MAYMITLHNTTTDEQRKYIKNNLSWLVPYLFGSQNRPVEEKTEEEGVAFIFDAPNLDEARRVFSDITFLAAKKWFPHIQMSFRNVG